MPFVTGALTGVSASSPLASAPNIVRTGINVSVWGTFVGTAQLQRSFDSGVTWLPLTSGGTSAFSYTAPASEVANEPEAGVEYRIACTAYTSGTINYRISQ